MWSVKKSVNLIAPTWILFQTFCPNLARHGLMGPDMLGCPDAQLRLHQHCCVSDDAIVQLRRLPPLPLEEHTCKQFCSLRTHHESDLTFLRTNKTIFRFSLEGPHSNSSKRVCVCVFFCWTARCWQSTYCGQRRHTAPVAVHLKQNGEIYLTWMLLLLWISIWFLLLEHLLSSFHLRFLSVSSLCNMPLLFFPFPVFICPSLISCSIKRCWRGCDLTFLPTDPFIFFKQTKVQKANCGFQTSSALSCCLSLAPLPWPLLLAKYLDRNDFWV